MKFTPGPINGLFVIEETRHRDERGFFSETFRQDLFEATIGSFGFVQDNHVLSAKKGTVRGLHCQSPPKAQGKLVRVSRGAVWDVAVDVRQGSPTFGAHFGIELDAIQGRQFWIPPGFLHGYCTLCDETEVQYKVTSGYDPTCDHQVRFDDPDLGIDWPVDPLAAQLSPKDRAAPRLKTLPVLFTYEGP